VAEHRRREKGVRKKKPGERFSSHPAANAVIWKFINSFVSVGRLK
jgi:hypothetical protein